MRKPRLLLGILNYFLASFEDRIRFFSVDVKFLLRSNFPIFIYFIIVRGDQRLRGDFQAKFAREGLCRRGSMSTLVYVRFSNGLNGFSNHKKSSKITKPENPSPPIGREGTLPAPLPLMSPRFPQKLKVRGSPLPASLPYPLPRSFPPSLPLSLSGFIIVKDFVRFSYGFLKTFFSFGFWLQT